MQTISNIEVSVYPIITIPRGKSGICTSNTLCIYKIQVNEISTMWNPQLILLQTVHLIEEVDLYRVTVTLINLLNGLVQLTKLTSVGSLQLYTLMKPKHCCLEINQVIVEKELLPHIPQDAKYTCSTEMDTHRKIDLDSCLLCSEAQKILDEFCEEYKDISSLHQGDIGHTKLP